MSEGGHTQSDAKRRRPPASRRLAGMLLRALAALFAALALAVGVAWLSWRFRPLPPPIARELFRGVRYTREIRRTPRVAVVHLVTVKIGTPGLRFLVTPGDPAKDKPLVARTTSGFLREHHVQLAVNGDFFEPWWSHGPHDYYPRRGDPVRVMGHAASGGVVYARGDSDARRGTLRFSHDERPSFSLPRERAQQAISGEPLLVDGELRPCAHHAGGAEPRTAVGLDRDESTLFLLVADGRQPHYSEGLTTAEVGATMAKLGAWNAINLDGGGSSALVMEDEPGSSETLSTPIHTRIPGRERPVANHLGVFAARLP